jgi:FkbM family methyltransferase
MGGPGGPASQPTAPAHARQQRVKVVDVGAMLLDVEPARYMPLVREGQAEVVGFEPQEAECARLSAQRLAGATFLPYAVGDGSERTFYETNAKFTSSLYRPNMALLSMFERLGEVSQVVSERRVQTKRLDDLPEVSGCDWLLLDVQGAELDVLRGAERLLGDVLVVETEVEFLPLYEGQPMFGDVDGFLRARGFYVHMLYAPQPQKLKACAAPVATRQLRHIPWANAVYVRDMTAWGGLSIVQLQKLCIIMHNVYGSVDMAALAMLELDKKTNGQAREQYLRSIAQSGPSAQAGRGGAGTGAAPARR